MQGAVCGGVLRRFLSLLIPLVLLALVSAPAMGLSLGQPAAGTAPTPWPTWTPMPTPVGPTPTPTALPSTAGQAKLSQFPFETCVISWCEEYYNAFDQGGPVGGIVSARRSNEISYYWGLNSPMSGINADNWAARYRRRVRLITPGVYRFYIYHDDGVKVLVNNVAVWPNDELWSPAGTPTTFDYFRRDVRGNEDLDIEVQFYDRVGIAYLRFWWEFEPSCELDPAGEDCQRFPLFFNGWRGEYFNSPNYPADNWEQAAWGQFEANNLTVIRDDRLSGPDEPGQPGEGIYFDWALAPPAFGINADGFMGRWTRRVQLSGGNYRFYLRTDDGGRLWIGSGSSLAWPYNNMTLLINDWRCRSTAGCQYAPPHTVIRDIYLSPGDYIIRVDLHDILGGAMVRFWWEAR